MNSGSVFGGGEYEYEIVDNIFQLRYAILFEVQYVISGISRWLLFGVLNALNSAAFIDLEYICIFVFHG